MILTGEIWCRVTFLPGQFGVCGQTEQRFSPQQRRGGSLPVSLSALIAPHLVPVCSFTGLLPCPTQPAQGSQHHHHHCHPHLHIHLPAQTCTLVNWSFSQGRYITTQGVKPFRHPAAKTNTQTKPPVTMWSSLSLDEIRWNFNDPCGEAGLLQLHVIGHTAGIKTRYKQTSGAKRGYTANIRLILSAATSTQYYKSSVYGD